MSGTQGDKSSSSSGPERSHLPFGFGDYVGGLGGQQQQQHHHDHHRLDVTNGANRRAAISSHPPTFPAGMLATTGRGFEHARTSAEPSLSVGAHYLNAASSSSATATTGLTSTTMTSRSSTTNHPSTEGYRRAGINLTASGFPSNTSTMDSGDGRPLGLISGTTTTVTGEGGQQFMLVPVYISHPPPQSNSFSLPPPLPPPSSTTTSAATVQAHFQASASTHSSSPAVVGVDTSTHGPIAELLALRHSSDHDHSMPMAGLTGTNSSNQERPFPPTASTSFHDSSTLQVQHLHPVRKDHNSYQHEHEHQHRYRQEDQLLSAQTRFHYNNNHSAQSTNTASSDGVSTATKTTKNNSDAAVVFPSYNNNNNNTYHPSAAFQRTTRPRTTSSSCSTTSSSDSDHHHQHPSLPPLPAHPSNATKAFNPEEDSTSTSRSASPDNDKTGKGIATNSHKRLLRANATSSTEVNQDPSHDHDQIQNAYNNNSSKKKRIDISAAAPTSTTKAAKGSSSATNTCTTEHKELARATTAAAATTTSQHQSNSNKQSNSSRFIWSSDLNDQFCSSVFQVGLKLASTTTAHSKLLANATSEGKVSGPKAEQHSTKKGDDSSTKSKKDSIIESNTSSTQQLSSQKQQQELPSLEEISHYLEDYRKHQFELMTLFSQTKFDTDHLPYRLGEFAAHLTFQSMKKANDERQKANINNEGEDSSSDSTTRASSPRSTVELQPPATESVSITSPVNAPTDDDTNVTVPAPSATHEQIKHIEVVSGDGQMKDTMEVGYDELPLPSLTPEEVASPIGKAMIHLVGLIHSINYQVVDGRIQAIKQRQQQQQQRDEGEENNERKNQTASSSFAHVQEATTRALCKKMEPSR